MRTANLRLSYTSALLLSLIHIYLLLSMCLGLTAFFLEENSGLRFIYSKLVFMLGTFLPLEFLPGWLANIARCLPFSLSLIHIWPGPGLDPARAVGLLPGHARRRPRRLPRGGVRARVRTGGRGTDATRL